MWGRVLGMAAKRDTLVFQGRTQWRLWLKSNHQESPGVWLEFRKAPASFFTYEDALLEAICFGWIDSLITRGDDTHYLRLFTPRRRGSEWSEANRERAVDLIAGGLMTEAGMEQVRVARERGLWYSKPSREFAMPAELEDALEHNEGAALFFSELAPSYRKRYMAYVASARKPETRSARAARVVALLAGGVAQALL